MASAKDILKLFEDNLALTELDIRQRFNVRWPMIRFLVNGKLKAVAVGKTFYYFLPGNYDKLPEHLKAAQKVEMEKRMPSLTRLGRPKQREHPYYFNHYRTLEQRKEYDRRRSELKRQFDPGFKQLQASYQKKYRDFKKQALMELSEKILAEMLREGEKVTEEMLQDSFNNAQKCTE